MNFLALPLLWTSSLGCHASFLASTPVFSIEIHGTNSRTGNGITSVEKRLSENSTWSSGHILLSNEQPGSPLNFQTGVSGGHGHSSLRNENKQQDYYREVELHFQSLAFFFFFKAHQYNVQSKNLPGTPEISQNDKCSFILHASTIFQGQCCKS